MKKMLILSMFMFLLILSGCTKQLGLKDREKPILYTDKLMPYKIGTPIPNFLNNILAYDNRDGDLTSHIKLDTSHVNYHQVGSYPIYISVSDKAGNKSTVKLNLEVKDKDAPIMSGTSDLSINIGEAPNLPENIVAEDNCDGDLTNQITVDDSSVDYNTIGTYPVIYSVTDSHGNSMKSKVTLTVNNQDQNDTTDSKLGLPVNLESTAGNGYQFGQPIFDSSWLSQITLIKMYAYGSKSTSYSSAHLDDFNQVNPLQAKDGFPGFIQHSVDDFKNEVGDVNRYQYQLYTMKEFQYSLYGLSLSNVYSDDYLNHLTPEFINDIDHLNNHEMSYTQFFNKYGTHVVSQTIYGGKAQFFGGILSNQSISNDGIYNMTSSDVSIAVPEGGGTSTSVSHTDDIHYLSLNLMGGNGLNVTSSKDFSDAYYEWLHSINEDNSVLVSIDQNHLIPIWYYLPSQYDDLRNSMQEQYNDYLLQNNQN